MWQRYTVVICAGVIECDCGLCVCKFLSLCAVCRVQALPSPTSLAHKRQGKRSRHVDGAWPVVPAAAALADCGSQLLRPLLTAALHPSIFRGVWRCGTIGVARYVDVAPDSGWIWACCTLCMAHTRPFGTGVVGFHVRLSAAQATFAHPR